MNEKIKKSMSARVAEISAQKNFFSLLQPVHLQLYSSSATEGFSSAFATSNMLPRLIDLCLMSIFMIYSSSNAQRTMQPVIEAFQTEEHFFAMSPTTWKFRVEILIPRKPLNKILQML